MFNDADNPNFSVNPYQAYYLQPYHASKNRSLVSLYEVKGERICSRMEHAWKKIIDRHNGLRVSFYQKDGNIYQVINRNIGFKINYRLNEAEKSFSEIVKEYCLPFDLEYPPLFRVTLFYKDSNYYWMLFEVHHAIIDGVSISVVFRDLIDCIHMQPLSDKFCTHYDYTLFLQNYLVSETMKAQQMYWENKLLNEPINFALPTKRQQVKTENPTVKPQFNFYLEGEMFRKIDDFVRENKITRFIFFAGIFTLILYEYSGSRDIVYVSPIAQRKKVNFKEVVSTLVNFVTLRMKIDEKEIVSQFFKNIFYDYFLGLANAEYPFSFIKSKIESPHAIDEVAFLYQDIYHEAKDIDSNDSSLSIRLTNFKSLGSSRIFRLEVVELSKSYYCNLSYNPNLFENEVVLKLTYRYQELLMQIIKDKNLRLINLFKRA